MISMRTVGIILSVSFAAASLAAGAALAQVQQPAGVSALKGHNSNAPVDVKADRIEVQDRADRALFVGNVHATQAELTLDTERLTVAYSNKPAAPATKPATTPATTQPIATNAAGAGVQIHRLDAAGGVVVHSPSETAKGDFGIYDLDRKLITIIGNVQLNQGQNVVNGQRLVINLDSGRAVVDGGPPGVNSSGGRVSGHFTVPQKKNAPATSSTPAGGSAGR
jgi:lipopolysaccharide export system protein LptA